jgi:hypothetical protein
MAITSAFQADDAGSIPAARSNPNVVMAQLIERYTLGKGVVPNCIRESALVQLMLSFDKIKITNFLGCVVIKAT